MALARHALHATLAITLAVSFCGSATAATVEGEAQFEFFLGSYSPAPDFLDSDISWGMRFGGNRYDSLTVVGELSFLNTGGNIDGVDVEWSSTFLDMIFEFNFAREKKLVPALFAGAGFAFTKSNGTIPRELSNGLNSDTLTVQGGGALKLDLGKRMFFRPAARFRWFARRSTDPIDLEFLLSIGWRWGNRRPSGGHWYER